MYSQAKFKLQACMVCGLLRSHFLIEIAYQISLWNFNFNTHISCSNIMSFIHSFEWLNFPRTSNRIFPLPQHSCHATRNTFSLSKSMRQSFEYYSLCSGKRWTSKYWKHWFPLSNMQTKTNTPRCLDVCMCLCMWLCAFVWYLKRFIDWIKILKREIFIEIFQKRKMQIVSTWQSHRTSCAFVIKFYFEFCSIGELHLIFNKVSFPNWVKCYLEIF